MKNSMRIKIWYMRPDHFRNGICGDNKNVDVNNLESTHILLATMDADVCHMDDNTILNDLYFNFQGENWSPNGEANNLIESKGLGHTSMSVGDIIALNNIPWVVKSIGFGKLIDE